LHLKKDSELKNFKIKHLKLQNNLHIFEILINFEFKMFIKRNCAPIIMKNYEEPCIKLSKRLTQQKFLIYMYTKETKNIENLKCL